jgi:hypothetical protein
MPAIVYLSRVFYGGQKVADSGNPKTAAETAGIVERFLNGTSLHPQEWNDFVECTHGDAQLDAYRKRCYELDPLANCRKLPKYWRNSCVSFATFEGSQIVHSESLVPKLVRNDCTISAIKSKSE